MNGTELLDLRNSITGELTGSLGWTVVDQGMWLEGPVAEAVLDTHVEGMFYWFEIDDAGAVNTGLCSEDSDEEQSDDPHLVSQVAQAESLIRARAEVTTVNGE